jgi:selenophosphate synthase
LSRGELIVEGVETELDVAGCGLFGHLVGHVAKLDVLEIRDRGIPPHELAL